jgi:regulatory protein
LYFGGDIMTRPTAYDYALNLLAARPYSTQMLRRKLVQREYSAHDVTSTIERLVGNGLLNDTRYAEQYARSKILSIGASKRRLQQELYRKGIKRDTATEAIAGVLEEENVDTAAMIERVAKKKLAQLGDLEPLVRRRRLFAFLARRGYDLDEIKGVVSRLA